MIAAPGYIPRMGSAYFDFRNQAASGHSQKFKIIDHRPLSDLLALERRNCNCHLALHPELLHFCREDYMN